MSGQAPQSFNKKELLDLISQAKTEEVISQLNALTDDIDDDMLRNAVIILSKNFHENKKH